MSQSRFRIATFGEPEPVPDLTVLEFEPGPRSQVTRRELWAIVDAAKAFHRRATMGRMDGDHFHRAKEVLESALEGLSPQVWGRN